MIALNEVLKKTDEFVKQYELMGKHYKLDRIISLEEKFIVIDDRKNKHRAECNKLCSQVAEQINNGNNPAELISQINKLDKAINKDEILSKRAMTKINKLLSKLPNIAIDKNTLNQVIKSKINPDFTLEVFLKQLPELITQNISVKNYLKLLKNRVFKLEDLPQSAQFNSKHQIEIVMLLDNNSKSTFDNFVSTLAGNAKIVINKSIKQLKKIVSKEIIAVLDDNTKLTIEFIGEYLSRDLNLKYYDKNLDMTKFVNMIKFKIKRHG